MHLALQSLALLSLANVAVSKQVEASKPSSQEIPSFDADLAASAMVDDECQPGVLGAEIVTSSCSLSALQFRVVSAPSREVRDTKDESRLESASALEDPDLEDESSPEAATSDGSYPETWKPAPINTLQIHTVSASSRENRDIQDKASLESASAVEDPDEDEPSLEAANSDSMPEVVSDWEDLNIVDDPSLEVPNSDGTYTETWTPEAASEREDPDIENEPSLGAASSDSMPEAASEWDDPNIADKPSLEAPNSDGWTQEAASEHEDPYIVHEHSLDAASSDSMPEAASEWDDPYIVVDKPSLEARNSDGTYPETWTPYIESEHSLDAAYSDGTYPETLTPEAAPEWDGIYPKSWAPSPVSALQLRALSASSREDRDLEDDGSLETASAGEDLLLRTAHYSYPETWKPVPVETYVPSNEKQRLGYFN